MFGQRRSVRQADHDRWLRLPASPQCSFRVVGGGLDALIQCLSQSKTRLRCVGYSRPSSDGHGSFVGVVASACVLLSTFGDLVEIGGGTPLSERAVAQVSGSRGPVRGAGGGSGEKPGAGARLLRVVIFAPKTPVVGPGTLTSSAATGLRIAGCASSKTGPRTTPSACRQRVAWLGRTGVHVAARCANARSLRSSAAGRSSSSTRSAPRRDCVVSPSSARASRCTGAVSARRCWLSCPTGWCSRCCRHG